jgi:hypothetical protein
MPGVFKGKIELERSATPHPTYRLPSRKGARERAQRDPTAERRRGCSSSSREASLGFVSSLNLD